MSLTLTLALALTLAPTLTLTPTLTPTLKPTLAPTLTLTPTLTTDPNQVKCASASSTLDLRGSLAAIHLDGLLGRIHARHEVQRQRWRAREQYPWDAELEEAAAAEDER